MASFVDRFRKPQPPAVAGAQPVQGAMPQTFESPLDGGKQQDTPYAEDGGGGGLLSPVDSGDANPPPVDGIWAGDNGEQRGGDDPGGIEPPIGPPHPPIDPDTGEPIPVPTTPTTPPVTPTNPNDLGPSIAARLKEVFNQGLSPTLKDSGLQGAVNASRVSGQRNLERQRALLAERASIEGTGDSGGFDTQLMGLTQDQGEKDRAFEGNLLANEGNNRVQQIMQALQLASGNQNQNNQLGLSYAQLLALLNSQALSTELNGA